MREWVVEREGCGRHYYRRKFLNRKGVGDRDRRLKSMSWHFVRARQVLALSPHLRRPSFPPRARLICHAHTLIRPPFPRAAATLHSQRHAVSLEQRPPPLPRHITTAGGAASSRQCSRHYLATGRRRESRLQCRLQQHFQALLGRSARRPDEVGQRLFKLAGRRRVGQPAGDLQFIHHV